MCRCWLTKRLNGTVLDVLYALDYVVVSVESTSIIQVYDFEPESDSHGFMVLLTLFRWCNPCKGLMFTFPKALQRLNCISISVPPQTSGDMTLVNHVLLFRLQSSTKMWHHSTSNCLCASMSTWRLVDRRYRSCYDLIVLLIDGYQRWRPPWSQVGWLRVEWFKLSEICLRDWQVLIALASKVFAGWGYVVKLRIRSSLVHFSKKWTTMK